MKPALVILAAGASSRLGTCKALVPLTPKNALELLSDAGASFDDSLPLVISGADHAAIAAALPRGLEIAFNERWAISRSSSVVLAAARRPDRDLVIAPVDVPLVPRSVFDALCAAWIAAGSPLRGWLAPCCVEAASPIMTTSTPTHPERMAHSPSTRVRYGHPIVIGRDLVRVWGELSITRSLRELRESATPLWSVRVDRQEVLDDLDSPADLVRLRARSRA